MFGDRLVLGDKGIYPISSVLTDIYIYIYSCWNPGIYICVGILESGYRYVWVYACTHIQRPRGKVSPQFKTDGDLRSFTDELGITYPLGPLG